MLSVAISACTFSNLFQTKGSGNILKKTYEVQNFDQVQLDTIGEVHIEQGETESLTIETDDNILPLLDVRVKDGVLILREKGYGHNFKPSVNILYMITVKDLSAVTTNASGDIFVDSLKTDDFSASSNASGDITVKNLEAKTGTFNTNSSGDITVKDLDARTGTFNTNASGDITVKNLDTKTGIFNTNASGDIVIAGKSDTVKVFINGSGDVFASELHAIQGIVSTQTSGNATVWTDDELQITIDGSGDVSYYGKPNLKQSIKGTGQVNNLGEK